MRIVKKNEVEFISAEFSICLLSYPSGSISGNIRWCPSPPLGSLFETTSNPQSVAISFKLGWSTLPCPPGILSTQDPGVVHLTSDSTAGTTSTCFQKGLLEGGLPASPLGCAVQTLGKIVGVFPCPCATSWSTPVYFQQYIISDELAVHFMLGLIYVKGSALSYLVLLAALYKN